MVGGILGSGVEAVDRADMSITVMQHTDWQDASMG